jgi:hypothetical protein
MAAAVALFGSSDAHNGPLLIRAERQAFSSSRTNERIYLLDRKKLRIVATSRWGGQAQLAPGGKLVAFNVGDRCPGLRLEVVRSDGTGKHRVAVAGVFPYGACPPFNFAWNAKGDRLAVIVAVHGVGHLRTLTPAGRILSDLKLPAARRGSIYTYISYDDLTWSPNGRWVGFEKSVGFAPVAYVLMHPDGTGRRIAFRTYEDHDSPSVSWSPDSSKLAIFTEGRDPRDPNLAVLDLRSGRMTRLRAEDVGQAAWSPDSKQLVFSTYPDHLVIVTSNGTVVEKIKTDPSPGPPVWSPDGRTIIFNVARNIDAVSVKGGKPHRITTIPPGWFPWGLDWPG